MHPGKPLLLLASLASAVIAANDTTTTHFADGGLGKILDRISSAMPTDACLSDSKLVSCVQTANAVSCQKGGLADVLSRQAAGENPTAGALDADRKSCACVSASAQNSCYASHCPTGEFAELWKAQITACPTGAAAAPTATQTGAAAGLPGPSGALVAQGGVIALVLGFLGMVL